MTRFKPQRTPAGGTLQAGLGFTPMPEMVTSDFLVRGVVTATYVYDDPAHPYAKQGPAGIYCDVLVYTSLNGGRLWPLEQVLVAQDGSSLQGGPVYRPRAATQSLSGRPLDPENPCDFTSWDGDHVLISFMDSERHLPVIIKYLPHPFADAGHPATDPIGQRVKLRLLDGDPRLVRHKGVFHGVDGSGNFVVDATQGHSADLAPGGVEPPGGPSSGSVILRASALGSRKTHISSSKNQAGPNLVEETLTALGYMLNFVSGPGAFAVSGAAGPLLAMAAPGGGGAASAVGAGMTIGRGGSGIAASLPVFSLLNQLITSFNTHTHPVAGAATGPPATPAVLVPAEAAIRAAGLSVPSA